MIYLALHIGLGVFVAPLYLKNWRVHDLPKYHNLLVLPPIYRRLVELGVLCIAFILTPVTLIDVVLYSIKNQNQRGDKRI